MYDGLGLFFLSIPSAGYIVGLMIGEFAATSPSRLYKEDISTLDQISSQPHLPDHYEVFQIARHK